MADWTNWSGSVSCHPASLVAPGNEDGVRVAVSEAADAGMGVRVAGTGHSFVPLCATDGVLIDLANLTARALCLFNIDKPTDSMKQMMTKLVAVTEIIKGAVPMLRKKRFADLLEAGRKVRQVEKEADLIYRSAITGLFVAEEIDFRELLKQKEALDDLERAVDDCDDVADLLSNLAVKHG